MVGFKEAKHGKFYITGQRACDILTRITGVLTPIWRAKMQHTLAWHSIAPHLKHLRLLGLYQLDPKTTPSWKYQMHWVYMRLVFCMPILYSIQACVYIYKEKDDVNKVIDSMFLFLSFTTSMSKQLVLWLRADQVEEILDIMKGPLLNPNVEHHKELLLTTAKHAKVLLYLFNCLSEVTCLTWVAFPLTVRLTGGSPEFAMWLPLNEQKFLYGVLFYILIQTTWVGMNSSTVDVLLAYLLEQCKTQLSILRSDLESLVERSEQLSETELIPFKQAFQKLFTSSLLHHMEITRLSKAVDGVFGGVLFYQFLVTGWIICTTAYRCISMDPASVEFYSMILYLCCILTEVFLFCYYGNELVHESGQLTGSVYNTNWLKISVEQRKSILIFLERVKRPIQPMAGGHIPLSLSTFLTIMRSSYSFYAFLKTTQE